ncbi:MAG TPA: class I SAM-dependent methyltransferase [Lachnospiraceae bacterium]|nr:class I SAM-dependent methyltransferase [Lachnospiraceae bacterium]
MDNDMQEVTKDDLIRACRKPEGAAGKMTIDRMNVSHAELTDWALSALEIHKADQVLDIGCGGGIALSKAAGQNPEGRCFGVDISPLSIEEAQNNNREAVAEGRMEFFEAGVSRLPFPDKSLDVIFSIESYYFWTDPENDLQEIRRTLKDGGQLLIALEYRADMDDPGRYSYNQEILHMNIPSSTGLAQQLKDAGFKNVTAETKGDWLRVAGIKRL